MSFAFLLAATLLSNVTGFLPAFLVKPLPTSHRVRSSTPLYMGMNRKARRRQEQQRSKMNRQKEFLDVVKENNEMSGSEEPSTLGTLSKDEDSPSANEGGKRVASDLGGEGESVVSGASIADAVPRNNDRPDVSEIVMDEDTGILRVVQGENVKDIVTGKAVKLSALGAESRLSQMFPDVSAEKRQKLRIDYESLSVSDIIEMLFDALSVEVEGGQGKKEIPPHPSVSDAGVDFVLANRDYLGSSMSRCLGRLKLRAQSQLDKDKALELRRLWKNFLTIENHISAPFRQIVVDAEKNIGPNFGNLDLKSYCSGEIYERTASYIVLKGMVAHWEKKVKDAEYVESTIETNSNFLEILMVGDPRRYLPDPPIIHRLEECLSVCLMARNMTQTFVSTGELYDDLPYEVRFVEDALRIKSGSELRRYIIEDFCPREKTTPEELREGVRRLHQQLENLQIDPYGDLANVVGRLAEAMAVGTDDARDPYLAYNANLGNDYDNNPGFFQTYTFDHDKLSLVSFLDYPMNELEEGKIQSSDLAKQLGRDVQKLSLSIVESASVKEDDISGQQIPEQYVPYKVPDGRSIGRPHMLGWLDILGDEELTGGEDNKDKNNFESDKWKEK